VRRLLVTATVVPSSPILVTLMKEALNSSETSVLTRATRPNIPDDTILHAISCHPNDDGGDTFLLNFALARATWCNIPEDGILHGNRRESLKS
jgi:hypothetical protein